MQGIRNLTDLFYDLGKDQGGRKDHWKIHPAATNQVVSPEVFNSTCFRYQEPTWKATLLTTGTSDFKGTPATHPAAAAWKQLPFRGMRGAPVNAPYACKYRWRIVISFSPALRPSWQCLGKADFIQESHQK